MEREFVFPLAAQETQLHKPDLLAAAVCHSWLAYFFQAHLFGFVATETVARIAKGTDKMQAGFGLWVAVGLATSSNDADLIWGKGCLWRVVIWKGVASGFPQQATVRLQLSVLLEGGWWGGKMLLSTRA